MLRNFQREFGGILPIEAGARLGPYEIEEAIGAELFPLVIRNRFVVTEDGERFRMLSPISGESIRPLSVVLNWHAGLEP